MPLTQARFVTTFHDKKAVPAPGIYVQGASLRGRLQTARYARSQGNRTKCEWSGQRGPRF